MEFPKHEQKMTPGERTIHEKRVARALDLAEGGATWRNEGGTFGPRLHITDEQLELFLKEKGWEQALDHLLKEIDAERGHTNQVETLADSAWKKLTAQDEVRFRGYVEERDYRGQKTLRYKDIQREPLGPDSVLEVTGDTGWTGPSQQSGSADVRSYTIKLTSPSRSGTPTTQAVGTIELRPELDPDQKKLVGDVIFIAYQKELRSLLAQHGEALTNELSEELHRVIVPRIRERVLRLMKQLPNLAEQAPTEKEMEREKEGAQ
ncbi:MAG: hypothetical protein HYS57_02610 [Parcubacteria group bacterium]|nr:hypothetical protein [Parcubacteria group bacterium]